MTTARRKPVSNSEFAAAIGCHYTMVSRLRSGDRLPSVGQLAKIIEVYGLDPAEAIAAVNAGKKAFSKYLIDNVFTAGPPDDGPASDSPT
jgi:transcriptional regulator with XRE-family HTH domain